MKDAKLKVIRFDAKDVIATSGLETGGAEIANIRNGIPFDVKFAFGDSEPKGETFYVSDGGDWISNTIQGIAFEDKSESVSNPSGDARFNGSYTWNSSGSAGAGYYHQ